MRIPTTLLLALLASTAGAQSLELPFAGVPVAQNTGAPDRGAAGNGSMGIGSGVEHLDEAERTDQGGPGSHLASRWMIRPSPVMVAMKPIWNIAVGRSWRGAAISGSQPSGGFHEIDNCLSGSTGSAQLSWCVRGVVG